MSEKTALDVLNRMVADGKIANYAIAGSERAWTNICPSLTEAVRILVSLPSGAPPANAHNLPKILACEGYAEAGEYGLKIEGWGVKFAISATALEEEALSRAVERDLPVENTMRTVRGRILRAEHFVAVMLASNSPQYVDWAIALIEDEEVNLDVLDDIVARHGLEQTYQKLCKVNAIGRYDYIDRWSRTSRYVQ